MKLDARVHSLEKALHTAGSCTVRYKVGRGPAGEQEISLEKALEAARKGALKSIHFPLTFHEQQAERISKNDPLEEIKETIEGIRRDTNQPAFSYRLVLCSKPVVFARQAPAKYSGGHPLGGNFITEDTNEEFHQSQWKELLDRRGAGFIIVLDYDESKEPWFDAGKENDHVY